MLVLSLISLSGLLAELGMSDISDVSDPEDINMSEVIGQTSSHQAAKLKSPTDSRSVMKSKVC